MNCSSKKFQYILALISTILFLGNLYKRSPSNLIPTDESLGVIFIAYFFLFPGLLWSVFIWSRWLYDHAFDNPDNPPISYEGFQCIATVVLFILAAYFIVTTFFIPIV